MMSNMAASFLGFDPDKMIAEIREAFIVGAGIQRQTLDAIKEGNQVQRQILEVLQTMKKGMK